MGNFIVVSCWMFMAGLFHRGISQSGSSLCPWVRFKPSMKLIFYEIPSQF